MPMDAGCRRASWLSLVVAALAGAACSSLPDYEVLHRTGSSRQAPRLVGERGVLSPAQTAKVIERLDREGKTDLLARHLAFTEAVSQMPLVAGNDVRLLIDGPATHRGMFAAVTGARDHINLETYIFEDDEVGTRLADLLLRKQAQGVQVQILYDSVGALGTSAEFFDRLRQAGVKVCEFNPLNPLRGRGLDLNHRDHRKILVVDGATAFAGGINISNVYSRSSSPARRRGAEGQGWRDTHIALSGPAVAELQKLFLANWNKQQCPQLAERSYFPRLQARGDKIVRIIGSSPDDAVSPIYVELLSAISHAEKSIHLTMAYFVPDPQTMDALKQAARRGVDVRLVLPGFSDFWIVFHAGRSHYAELLEAGVRIFERRDAMLHAKTAVIDGVWATVGSANMDWRSFLHNDEVNAVILGESFAREMEAMFDADVANSTPVDPVQWKRRSYLLRLREWMARRLEYWL